MTRVPGIALLIALAAGCGGNPAAPALRTFDLGYFAPAAKLPALRVASARSAAPFDGPQMYYRLAWRHPSELADYANSRWAGPPAELLRKQILRATGAGPAICALEIELQEFTQIFASRQESEARIELRVALVYSSVRIAAHGITVVEPGAGGDAASGAAAMARAAERVLGELAAWVRTQSACV